MEDLKNVYAVILAAGKGTRFHGRKQFLEIHDKPLWKHLYDNVADVIPSENIIVVGVDIEGGETRSGSVKKGLDWIYARGNCHRVIIMEAARTLVTRKQIEDIAMNDALSCCYVYPL